MALRFMSAFRQRAEQEEASRRADEIVGSGVANDAVEEASDIHEFILDSTTMLFVQMFLALIAGTVVLTLLRTLGVTADPLQSVYNVEQASEGYNVFDMWQDLRCFLHFGLGVFLCFVLQGGQQGDNSQHFPEGEAVAEPQKGGIYTWLLW